MSTGLTLEELGNKSITYVMTYASALADILQKIFGFDKNDTLKSMEGDNIVRIDGIPEVVLGKYKGKQ